MKTTKPCSPCPRSGFASKHNDSWTAQQHRCGWRVGEGRKWGRCDAYGKDRWKRIVFQGHREHTGFPGAVEMFRRRRRRLSGTRKLCVRNNEYLRHHRYVQRAVTMSKGHVGSWWENKGGEWPPRGGNETVFFCRRGRGPSRIFSPFARRGVIQMTLSLARDTNSYPTGRYLIIRRARRRSHHPRARPCRCHPSSFIIRS